jgi:hypothetical protein
MGVICHAGKGVVQAYALTDAVVGLSNEKFGTVMGTCPRAGSVMKATSKMRIVAARRKHWPTTAKRVGKREVAEGVAFITQSVGARKGNWRLRKDGCMRI